MSRRPSVFRHERWERPYFDAYEAVLRSWPVPVESRLVQTRFGGTHVLSCGPEKGPPTVLLHGAGVSATMWRPNIAALSAHRRVHAVDTLWDVGKGEPTVFPQSHAEATEWFVGLLDELGHERVDLVGLSYGGFLSLRFTIDAPERIKRLVVLAPAASLSGLSGKFFVNALGILLVPTRPAAICRALLRWATEKEVAEDLAAQWIRGARGLRINSPIQKIPPLVLSDDELRSVRPPSLLLMGDGEWTCRDPAGGMERFRTLVPDGAVELIPAAGHILSMDQPETVNAFILDHVDQG